MAQDPLPELSQHGRQALAWLLTSSADAMTKAQIDAHIALHYGTWVVEELQTWAAQLGEIGP